MSEASRKHYDNIVVGSGASGLSLAHLLALSGKKVLLLEKHWYLGGSLTRFRKKGIPLDTGFHFTGGFANGGILHDMLTALGIRDQIEPIILDDPKSNRYVFEQDGSAYDLPAGVENFKKALIQYFPHEEQGIESYFDLSERCYSQTLSLDLLKITQVPNVLEEDYKTLETVLDELIKDKKLRGILATYCMCYGVKPSEVSFANHARVAHGLYDAVVRVKGGGDAFVEAFKEEFKKLDMDIRLRTYITECKDIKNREVGYFVLNDGEEVTCDQCIFTIHPNSILATLPKEHLSKAFVDRVGDFEPSLGFFSLYCLLDTDNPDEPLVPAITSLLPEPDVNELLDPTHEGPTAVVVLTNNEYVKGKLYKVLTALEPAFFKDVAEWKDTYLKKRGEAYENYKKNRIEQILKRITDFYPEYKDRLEVIEAASMLSYRDFLNSPDGTAYGIKQKVGQINLFGRLPLRNLYASGQSAVLPGVVGAMMSSFIILRAILGRDAYDSFMKERVPQKVQV
jgi:all-trans-retinol 13,14-reductase